MEYFILHIEGLSVKGGEKIKTLDSTQHTYTTKMTEALRVKKGDIPRVSKILKSQGLSNWAVATAPVYTSYAPKGSIWFEVKAYKFKDGSIVHRRCLRKFLKARRKYRNIFDVAENIPASHITAINSSTVGRFGCCDCCREAMSL